MHMEWQIPNIVSCYWPARPLQNLSVTEQQPALFWWPRARHYYTPYLKGKLSTVIFRYSPKIKQGMYWYFMRRWGFQFMRYGKIIKYDLTRTILLPPDRVKPTLEIIFIHTTLRERRNVAWFALLFVG